MQHAPGPNDGPGPGTRIAPTDPERQRQSILAFVAGLLSTTRPMSGYRWALRIRGLISVPSGAGLHMLAGPYSTVQTS